MRAVIFPLLCIFFLASMTIDEKKAQDLNRPLGQDVELDDYLHEVNDQSREIKEKLEVCNLKLLHLKDTKADNEEYRALLKEVQILREELFQVESSWRKSAVRDATRDEEGYALWDQEETTLSQLVMEYGASDYLYIVPPDLAAVKLNMHSSIPVPRESWSEVLEIILSQSGIGVKQVNPYARQLYHLKQDLSAVGGIISKRDALRFFSEYTRIFYLFSPPPEQQKSAFQFFERFADAKQTFLYQIGGKVAIVAPRHEVEKLLTLHDTVWREEKGKISRVVSISKMPAKEMEKVLRAFFAEQQRSAAANIKGETSGLSIFPSADGGSLVLVGEKYIVDRAEKIVNDTEEQLHNPAEKTIYLYQCRHSDPGDLATVLEKVYTSLLAVGAEEKKENVDMTYSSRGGDQMAPDGYETTPPLVVTPPKLHAGVHTNLQVEEGSDNFIPDPKTGTVLMVVRKDILPRIKELIRGLDVPKKMVNIEVLLFEKKLTQTNNFGLNLLHFGGTRRYFEVSSSVAPTGTGITEFFWDRDRQGSMPALKVDFTFMMTQEDTRLNTAPSITTVNQTPATISIVEEISINNGAAPVDTNKGIAFEKSYTRAQYGTIIVITPTVHAPLEGEDGEDVHYVTLDTNITFDTTKASTEDRPPVDRRNIQTQVRVADGQTAIIGGLRRKNSTDDQQKVPFLGELPLLGRLFGSTKLVDTETEMYFFITPKVILDPKEQLDKIREEELALRPGDIPEFLKKVVKAQLKRQRKFFDQSMRVFMTGNVPYTG